MICLSKLEIILARILLAIHARGKYLFGPCGYASNRDLDPNMLVCVFPQNKFQTALKETRGTYCGWTKSCTTLIPWETVICWYLQRNDHSRGSYAVRSGFRPSTVPLVHCTSGLLERVWTAAKIPQTMSSQSQMF